MKNYLSKHYQHYYIQTEDGQELETTRAECIAPGEEHYAQEHYVQNQRWYHDIEAGYIVRLSPRGEQSETLHRMSEQCAQNEERNIVRNFACVLKDTGRCDNDCDNCQRKHYSRTIELDRPLASDGETDSEPMYFDPGAIETGYAEVDENDAFFRAIGRLNEKQQRLARLYYYEEKTTYEIAAILKINQSNAHRQLETLKKTLKKYYEEL